MCIRDRFNTKIHPRGFRQYLDYANGTLGDWGIHWLDQLLWIMEEKYPRTVSYTHLDVYKRQNADEVEHQIHQ